MIDARWKIFLKRMIGFSTEIMQSRLGVRNVLLVATK